MRLPTVLLAASLLAAADAQADDAACGLELPCSVATGTYRAAPPPGWDGRKALPTAFFFHGHGGSAADEMANAGLRAAFAGAGVLLVVPDGVDGRWSHGALRPGGRDDFGFFDQVLADVRRRWPVDEARLWASGFSSGAFVVWDIACRKGGFRAYVPIAGAFLGPIPASCPAGPVDLLQVHGLTDGTVPIEGRWLRQGLKQADLFASFALLRETDGCRPNADRYEQSGELTLRIWGASCSSGRILAMALHPGGHELPEGWFELAWQWVQSLPGRDEGRPTAAVGGAPQ